MKPDPDFEAYAQTLRKIMDDATAKADALAAEAAADRDAAAVDRETAYDILHELEMTACRIAENYVEENYKKIAADIRQEVLALAAVRLLNSGYSTDYIVALLEVSPEFAAAAGKKSGLF